jgi:arginine:ornithine antiporter/lysine permease
VSYFILIKPTLGAFFPIFGEGNTLPAELQAALTEGGSPKAA